MTNNINSVFSPKSIVVIGASSKEGSVGRVVFSNILLGGFTGILFPVNPKRTSILGVKCYPSISNVPDPVDLAVVIVPAEIAATVLEECGKFGVKGVIIITAGFKEIGKEGAELEKKVVEIANKYKIVLVGPNCLGIINTDISISMNATFGRFMPKPGNIAFISQSGALCTAVLDYAKGENIGFSKFISMGNKAGLKELDLLLYLKDDPLTKVILMYVEDLSNPGDFIKVAREITGEGKVPKPIIALKSGRTSEGAKAASSHTGALAGSDEIYDALFAQSGVLRVEGIEDLFDCAVGFANAPLPKGNKVAIVTNAGGPGIMTTDAAIRYGLQLAKLEDKTVTELRRYLPKTSNFNNPIDVIGDARNDRYEIAINNVLNDKNVDSLIVILTPQSMTDIEEIANTVVKIAKGSTKPVLACFMGIVDVLKGVDLLEENHVPHFKFPEDAARTLGSMVKYGKWIIRPRTTTKEYKVDKETAKKVLEKVKKEGRSYLPEIESLEVLNAYGFPTLKSMLAKNNDECLKFAKEIGYPVAMKIVSPDIIHKFDVKGVVLKLKSDTEVKEAYENIMRNVKKLKPDAKILGVNIQEMAKGGEETIIGAKRDEVFGPLIMFGLGGIFVEVMRDVSFRLVPLRQAGAMNMIKSIKTYKILEGVRGNPPADINSIAECLLRLSQLIMDFEEIYELDMNPLIVYPKGEGCKVADVRIMLK
ncbi:MAG: acetate--CoA ligase alpha subunit [Candidatus Firestonebacteria bacterium]